MPTRSSAQEVDAFLSQPKVKGKIGSSRLCQRWLASMFDVSGREPTIRWLVDDTAASRTRYGTEMARAGDCSGVYEQVACSPGKRLGFRCERAIQCRMVTTVVERRQTSSPFGAFLSDFHGPARWQSSQHGCLDLDGDDCLRWRGCGLDSRESTTTAASSPPRYLFRRLS